MLSHWFSARKSGKSSSLPAQHREVAEISLKRKADASVRSPFPSAANPADCHQRPLQDPSRVFLLSQKRQSTRPSFQQISLWTRSNSPERNEKKQVSLKVLNSTGAETVKCFCPCFYCDPTGILKHFQHTATLLHATTSSCSATYSFLCQQHKTVHQ